MGGKLIAIQFYELYFKVLKIMTFIIFHTCLSFPSVSLIFIE